MIRRDHLLKTAAIFVLLFFAVMTVYHARYPINEGPFFFRRLARLEYALNTDPELYHRKGQWSSFAWASDHPGGDITVVSTAVAMGATLLATVSIVTDVPLWMTSYLPILQIGAGTSCYLLVRELVDHQVGIVSGLFMLTISTEIAHFHEYRFGRFVALPLFLYFAYRMLTVASKRDRTFAVIGVILSFLLLKFTAPGTEPVALAAIIFMAIAGMIFGRERNWIGTSALYTTLVFLVLFFLLNPKLYGGVIAGLTGHSTGHESAVTVTDSGLGAQLQAMIDHLSQFLGSSSESSGYGYSPPRSFIEARFSQAYKIIPVVSIGLYGIANLIQSTRQRSWSPQFILVSGLVIGISTVLLMRGVLLGRFGAKGMIVLIVAGGLTSFMYFVGKDRTIQIGIVLICLAAVSIGAGVFHGDPGKPYHSDSAEEVSQWQATHVPNESAILMDYMSFGNTGHFHAKNGVSEYWNRYSMASWTEERYETFVEGGTPTDVDYVLVDKEVAKYGTKPRSYNRYQPLDPHLTEFDDRQNLNRIHSNDKQIHYIVQVERESFDR